MRLLCILGYPPRINACVNCKTKDELMYFSIKDNGFKCKNCGKQDKSAIQMSRSTQSAIRYVAAAPSKKLFSFDLRDESLEEFKLITKIYFDQKLEKEYKVEELF